MSHRRKLVHLLDSGVMAGGVPPVTSTSPDQIAGLGSWYKNDTGIWNRSAAQPNGTNSYLSAAHTSTLSLINPNGYTVGGWVWIDATPSAPKVIVAKRGTTNVEWQLYITNPGSLIFTLYNGSGYPGASASLPSVGAWHFVVFRWHPTGAGTGNIYVNNVSVGTNTTMGSPTNGTGSLGFGVDVSALANYWPGRLQNWFTFARYINDSEGTFLYNSGAGRRYSELGAGDKVDMRTWWPMDEKSGSRRDLHGGVTLTDNNTVAENDGKVLNSIADGLRVYQWNDAGPKALHLSQTTLSKRPTYTATGVNGQPGILFTLANLERLDTAAVALAALPVSAGDGDAWGVLKNASTAATTKLWAAWDQSATNRYLLADIGATGQLYDHGNSTNARILAGGASGLSPVLLEMYRSGSAMELRRNNTTLGTVTAASSLTAAGSTTWHIGGDPANQTFNGHIAEAVFYTAGLSAADRTGLRAYFNTKYSLGF